jgi:hypothetical protein
LVKTDIKAKVSIDEIRNKYPMWYLMHHRKLKDYYKEIKEDNNIMKNKNIFSLIPNELKFKIAKQIAEQGSTVFFYSNNEIETY